MANDHPQAPPDWPPVWAVGWGVDTRGVYAEASVRGVGFPFRWIPPGSFLMGSPEDEVGRYSGEGPQHLVTLTQGFWMTATPCTQEQWKAVTGESPSHFRGVGRPVETVNWEACREFSGKLNEFSPGLHARLPTEAEWEYACRAGTTSGFNDGSGCTRPFGRDPALDRLGWFDRNSGDETRAVGGKEPNGWGLHDMHGNVWEWCEDRAEEAGKTVADRHVAAAGPRREKHAGRIVRGGSCWYESRLCRSACRNSLGLDQSRWDLGFRLAAGQPPEASVAAVARRARAPKATGPAAGGADAPRSRDATPADGTDRGAR